MFSAQSLAVFAYFLSLLSTNSLVYTQLAIESSTCDGSITRCARDTDEDAEKVLNWMKGKTLKTKCIATHVHDVWQFNSITTKIDMYGNFEQNCMIKNGTVIWRVTGRYYVRYGLNYIGWRGQGRIPDGEIATARGGRMYILGIHPAANDDHAVSDDAVITYYSCWEGREYTNWNVYIVYDRNYRSRSALTTNLEEAMTALSSTNCNGPKISESYCSLN